MMRIDKVITSYGFIAVSPTIVVPSTNGLLLLQEHHHVYIT